MKLCALVLAALLAIQHAHPDTATRHASLSFGPHNCVMLSRSQAGSCVIATKCAGTDTSGTEFAFNCASNDGGIIRHSFGVGGFEAAEEFDTNVKCDRCERPTPMSQTVPQRKQKISALSPKRTVAERTHRVSPKAKPRVKAIPDQVVGAVAVSAKHRTSQKNGVKFWPFKSWWGGSDASKDSVKYGPNACVSTYRNPESHCIVQTKCGEKDISNYEFGLICVDKTGAPVRHLFGKGSFDSEETFDTLIKCDKCLGLEDIPSDVAVRGDVTSLSTNIANLKDVMHNITTNVQMLNEEVFQSNAGPSPAAAPAPAPAKASSAGAKALLHRHVRHRRHMHGRRHAHKKHHLRRSQRRHHEDNEEDDDDDHAAHQMVNRKAHDDEWDEEDED